MESLDHTWQLIVSLLGAFASAVAGVAMRYAHAVSRGDPFAWRRVFLDVPTIFVMGITAGAIGAWLHDAYGAPEIFTWMLAANFGYLGPTVVDRIADLATGWLKPRDKDKSEGK